MPFAPLMSRNDRTVAYSEQIVEVHRLLLAVVDYNALFTLSNAFKEYRFRRQFTI